MSNEEKQSVEISSADSQTETQQENQVDNQADTTETQTNIFDDILSELGDNEASDDTASANENENANENKEEVEVNSSEEVKSDENAVDGTNTDSTNNDSEGEAATNTMDQLVALNTANQDKISQMAGVIDKLQQKDLDAETKANLPYYKQILDATPEQIKQQLEYDAQGNHLGYEVDGVQMKLISRIVDDAINHVFSEFSPVIGEYKSVVGDRAAEVKLVAKTKGDINNYGEKIKLALRQKFPNGLPKEIDKWSEIERTYNDVRRQSLRESVVRVEKEKQAKQNQNVSRKMASSPPKKAGAPEKKKSGFDEIIAELG